MDLELLQEIGLTKAEIKVYLALLELGSSTTGPIVDKSGASSSKIYEVLEKLMQKGLVSFVIKSGVKYFESAPPRRILEFLQEKQRRLNEQTKQVETLLPELELKQTLSKEKSETVVFKGMKGAETAFNDILALKKGEEVLVIGFSEIHQEFQIFLKKFHQKRAKLGIKARAVFGKPLESMVNYINALPHSKVKFYPEQQEHPVAILIYKDKTLFSLPKDYLWIQVKNQRLADSFRSRFEELWAQNIHVYKGFESVTNKFWSMLDMMNEGDEYYVLGATHGERGKPLKEWFIGYHADRIKRKISAKLLCSPKEYESIMEQFTTDPGMKVTELRTFSQEFSSPMQINLYKGNKVLMFLWTKDITCFEIESEILHKNFKAYFDALWNQEITIEKGFDAYRNALLDILTDLTPQETWDCLGAALGPDEKRKEYVNLFREIHDLRAKKNVPCRLLFYQDTAPVVAKHKADLYDRTNAQIKFLPYGTKSPVQVFMTKNKTILSIQEENPTVITINNKKIAESFRKHFESIWNQQTYVVHGLDAVQDIFEEMLQAGSVDFIGARGYFVDQRPEYIDNWEKRAIESGFKMRNIVDLEVKGHRITEFSFAKTKYTLPKEFSALSVFWIYGDKVVISNWMEKEPILIVINNKNIHQLYKQQFEVLWTLKEIKLR